MEDFDLILAIHLLHAPLVVPFATNLKAEVPPYMPAEKRSDFRPPHGHFSFVTFSHHHQKDYRNLAKSKKQHGKKKLFFFWS